MSEKRSRPDVARCRADMAELLAEVVATTRRLEERLDVVGGWSEATAEIDLEADPVETPRVEGALLLRKARIHAVAALRANETSNLHSLAVQMRPVLECAGQIVFKFKNAIIAPDLLMSREQAAEMLAERLNADYYQTLRSRTKGEVSAGELRASATQAQTKAAVSSGEPPPRPQKSWSLRQEDKVASLEQGREWYAYLSEYFSHGRGVDWKGLSWRGGVVSMDQVEDQLAFLGLTSYLVHQVAAMNAAAALCPVAGESGDQWERWVEPALAEVRYVRESSKALLAAARAAVTGELDASARTV